MATVKKHFSLLVNNSYHVTVHACWDTSEETIEGVPFKRVENVRYKIVQKGADITLAASKTLKKRVEEAVDKLVDKEMGR
jgi:ribosomal protein S12